MNLRRNAGTTPGSRAAMVRRLKAGESKAAVAAAPALRQDFAFTVRTGLGADERTF